MKHAINKNTLKGVSTLDIIKKSFKYLTFLLILTAFSPNIFGGHSTLDLVDPSFNPQVQTTSYGLKWVSAVEVLPDGKLLVLGYFNAYNRVPVGKLVRLNPDGTLDTTFNNQTVTAIQNQIFGTILIQPDGKIVLRAYDLVAGNQGPKPLLRLNADGTLDSSFNYPQTEFISRSVMDSFGRILLMGDFTTPNGTRRIVRLNDDGSFDNSFNFTLPAGTSLSSMEMQGNKLIVNTNTSNNRRIYRLNEDGSEDATFTPLNGTGLGLQGVQPGNKVIYSMSSNLFRLNENGGSDATFQPINFSGQFGVLVLKFTGGGKLVTSSQGSPAVFKRYLPDGAVDPSFTQYTTTRFACYTILPDDSIVMGDGDPSLPRDNSFIKLTPGGTVDPTFNPGGDGFKTVQPGIISAIEAYPDGKILFGGKFDLINDVSRYRLARLNPDSTVDTTFQVNTTSGSGNYFSIIRDIYQVRRQADGKIVVSGAFDYHLNSVLKKDFVRLNSDGSIDPTFDLTYPIFDQSVINLRGQNRFVILSDGSIIVGTSKSGTDPGQFVPVKLTPGGARDTSFNPTLFDSSFSAAIHDIALQPDGKVLVSGTRDPTIAGDSKTFVVRFNTDGSTDSSFSHPEEDANLTKSRLALLPDGKILVTKNLHPSGGSARLQRLNSDGSVDNTFTTLSLSDPTASLNALLVLPNGKIFVGGRFTLTVNGQPAKNLLQLDADGNFEPTLYNLNEEVLALAVDGEGRVLVGGGFTVIETSGGSGATRSYIARLADSRLRFDFDGDGRSDLGTYTDANGFWNILHSGSNQTAVTHFGLSGDKTAPADYDGDGKADYAVFRPSNGVWYLWKSRDGFTAIQWGLAEDKPVAADYDGDGLADVAVWRPSSRVWYVLQSSNGQFFAIQFGLSDDIPLTDADFDGDGKADIAVWRPSNGVFYWLASDSGNQFRAVQWGQTGDVPVVGDFNGDGKTDLVVFRPADGNWYQYLTAPNGNYAFAVFNFGLNGDEPVAADYDGDGKTDIAVRRQNIWHIQRSGQGYTSLAFADANDQAVASSLNR